MVPPIPVIMHDQFNLVAESFTNLAQTVWQIPLNIGHDVDTCATPIFIKTNQGVFKRIFRPGVHNNDDRAKPSIKSLLNLPYGESGSG